MNATAHAFTHVGQRQENQDRLTVLRSGDGDGSLFLVADGLGGHRGGSLAAQTVVDTAADLWARRGRDWRSEDFLRSLVSQCHERVNAAGRAAGLDPRSTLAALLVRGSEAVSVHAGDSRVMQYSRAGLAVRTLDHSMAQLNVLRGAISEAELATHPSQTHLLTHVGGEAPPDAEFKRWRLARGTRFVICSDGFWEIFSDGEIVALFESADPGTAVAAAYEGKLAELERHDNTTAILAVIDPGPRVAWYWLSLAALVGAGLAAALLPAGRDARGQATSAAGRATALFAGGAGPSYSLAAQAEGREGAGAREGGSREGGASPAEGASESGGRSESGGGPGSPVPIDSLHVSLDRRLKTGESLASAIEDELRQAGRIGPADTLAPKGSPGRIGGTTVSRFGQTHEGMPVFAAEVVATTEGSRVIRVDGHLASRIEVDGPPARDYPETVALAERASGEDIDPLDEGSLVVVRMDGRTDVVAWSGSVATGRGSERVILDPATGAVLFREPLVLQTGRPAVR